MCEGVPLFFLLVFAKFLRNFRVRRSIQLFYLDAIHIDDEDRVQFRASDLFERDLGVPVVEVAETFGLPDVFAAPEFGRNEEYGGNLKHVRRRGPEREPARKCTVPCKLTCDPSPAVGERLERVLGGDKAGFNLDNRGFRAVLPSEEIAYEIFLQRVLNVHLFVAEFNQLFRTEELHRRVVDLYQVPPLQLEEALLDSLEAGLDLHELNFIFVFG